MKKICFISSCGGHFTQLLKLLPVAEGMNYYIVTERNLVAENIINANNLKHHFLLQQERKNIMFIVRFIANILLSLYFFLKERPDYIITTGAGVVLPTCIYAKLFGTKIIYLESFARIYSASKTGQIVYKFADYFYVQWEEMLKIYPKAIYDGAVY